jgi:molybdopterin molybdotransferase
MSKREQVGKSRRGARGSEGLLPVEEARRIVEGATGPIGAEEVALDDALGRILAERIVAPNDVPAVDRSAMDGYAFRAADVASVPAELAVVEFLPAGRGAEGIVVGPGQAVRIMTGAPVPRGADAIQMIERTESAPDGKSVRVLASVASGANILVQAEDVRRGEEVLRAGTRIRSPEIGVLAAFGRLRPRVYRRPKVHILSTGDEVVEAAAAPLPHQVRNSNGPAVAALLREVGIAPIPLGIVGDDRASLDAGIRAGLEGDMLVLIGGVSVGDRDLVAGRLAAAGVTTLFHRIAMKPGKPLLFGRRGGCLVFGLPGNPLSALTACMLFVLPAAGRLMGQDAVPERTLKARLAAPLRQKPGRTWYRLAAIELQDGIPVATPVPSSSSGDLISATRANGFIVVPAETAEIAAGSDVGALLWAWPTPD